MKKLFLAIVFFILLSVSNVFSQPPYSEEYKVGKQPAMILEDPSVRQFHIFCLGYDANFDGVYDIEAGDEKPSWWIYGVMIILKSGMSKEYEETKRISDKIMFDEEFKLRDFDYSIGAFATRPAYSDTEVYFVQNSSIIAYRLEDGMNIGTVAVNVNPTAMSYYEGKLFLSQRMDAGNDVVLIYDLANKRYLDTIAAYKNVQMTAQIDFLGKSYLIILNEGNFGAGNSKLQIIDMSNNNEEIAVLDIGDSGNYIDFIEENDDVIIAAAMNGSHQVQIISLTQKAIINTIDLPSDAYNGPRELHFNKENNELLVSSYDGNIYEVDAGTGLVEKYVECKSKPEGFYSGMLYNDYLLVANIMDKDSYAPDSTVSVYVRYTSVEENTNLTLKNVFPNPAKDLLNIEIPENTSIDSKVRVEIYSSEGILVKREICAINNNNLISLSNLDLASGAYYIKILSGKRVFYANFNVLK